MALIDVTELMVDPDFVDIMQVVTRREYVDSLGQSHFEENILSTVGSIQPASGEVVKKLPESMQTSDVSTFFFKGKIIASAPGKYSSIIIFNGNRYQVQKVNDFSNWGEGFTEGICVVETPA